MSWMVRTAKANKLTCRGVLTVNGKDVEAGYSVPTEWSRDLDAPCDKIRNLVNANRQTSFRSHWLKRLSILHTKIISIDIAFKYCWL